MVANKPPSTPELYAGICSVLKATPKLTVLVVNHIAAKHSIHSLPAFHASEAVSDDARYKTYAEIVRALVSKDYSKLLGQVAQGQAAGESVPPAPLPVLVAPAVIETPAVEPKSRVTQAGYDPESIRLRSGQKALADLVKRGFIGQSQAAAVREFMNGEEYGFYCDKMVELLNVVDTMPRTYDTRNSRDPLTYLHYYIGSCDWYIAEADKGSADDAANEVPPQSQAWGFANLGDPDNAETGYISLAEVLENGAELDFHWKPKPISACRPGAEAGRDEPSFEPSDLTKSRHAVIPIGGVPVAVAPVDPLAQAREDAATVAAKSAPVGESPAKPAVAPSCRPLSVAELHAYLDHCIEAAQRIPGSSISIHIGLPTHV